MSQYLILIYEDEKAYAAQDPSVWQTAMEAHGRFAEQVVEHGGKILGPFAETKEALGGFYLIEAADLDRALAIAKLCPAPYGGVEVRPIMDTSGG